MSIEPAFRSDETSSEKIPASWMMTGTGAGGPIRHSAMNVKGDRRRWECSKGCLRPSAAAALQMASGSARPTNSITVAARCRPWPERRMSDSRPSRKASLEVEFGKAMSAFRCDQGGDFCGRLEVLPREVGGLEDDLEVVFDMKEQLHDCHRI